MSAIGLGVAVASGSFPLPTVCPERLCGAKKFPSAG